MKLLIVTQAVDRDDPILGFFHRWIKEFGKHCEHVDVVCLTEGRHELPKNVRVHSLGKEGGRSRLKYVFNFYRYLFGLRSEYDAVFVHMNPEYVVLGGMFWRLMRKPVALWYTHKNVDLKLRLAEKLANVVMTASPESFRLASRKLMVMGHGIDTDFFSPDPSSTRGDWWLSVGRLTESKRHDRAIREAAAAGKQLHIAGDGPERQELEALAKELNANVVFLGGITQAATRDEYRTAALLIHRSETGSLDKVVLEAAACGLPVDSTDPAIKRMPLSREYVQREHSLPALIEHILSAIPTGV